MNKHATFHSEFTKRLKLIKSLTPETVSSYFFPSFVKKDLGTPIAHGMPILQGDVTGQLILNKDIPVTLSKYARDSVVQFIYSTSDGDLGDFTAIKNCSAYITSNPAKTVFLSVQSVSEGKPTVIGLEIEYYTDLSQKKEYVFYTSNNKKITISDYKRWLVFNCNGQSVCVEQGDFISVSGTTGCVYNQKIDIEESEIALFYDVLSKCYLEAVDDGNYENAWDYIENTKLFKDKVQFLERVANSKKFKNCQDIIEFAIANTPLAVYANVHSDLQIIKNRLVLSRIEIHKAKFSMYANEAKLGAGLIRDERMWRAGVDIDLLRLVFIDESCFKSITDCEFYRIRYQKEHGERYYKIFMANPGNTIVLRTLCMPLEKLFPYDFNHNLFAEMYNLNRDSLEDFINSVVREREIFHGCRGVRIFTIKPELASLWVVTILNALKKARLILPNLKIRFLLATLTLPDEAQRFLNILEQVVDKLYRGDDSAIIGVSMMLETTGAYISLEEILMCKTKRFSMNGGLVGTNDFTAACLNMNRTDAPKYNIPEYIKQNIFSTSPFNSIYKPIVGKAMIQALQRSTVLSESKNEPHLWGLAGELTTDWRSLQWMIKLLHPAGLNYVSTAPESIPMALMAIISAYYKE